MFRKLLSIKLNKKKPKKRDGPIPVINPIKKYTFKLYKNNINNLYIAVNYGDLSIAFFRVFLFNFIDNNFLNKNI